MPIAYDEMVSFAENLKRLKEYTTLHSSDPNLPVVLTAFVDSLLAHTKGELPSIRDALEQQDGTAAYRNLLLACLVNSDAPAIDIEDLVWQAALNFSDAIEVRRTATYLLGQLERPTRRPDDLILLLSDADTDIVAFALANSRQHLDIRGYDYIKANLLDSPDINVRVAAVNVIGEAPFSDVQAVLTSILAGHTTSKDDAFSLESLPKRAAIMYLDMRDNATHELVRQIALNEEEDPGVRAKAISRFIPADNSTTTQWLLDLLQKTGSDNAVVYRAIVDALVIQPTPGIVDAINKRTNQLSDEQMKAAIFRRVKLATSRGPS